jgi:hypothetical protein
MTLTQLIQDMTQLNLELSRFENQFGVKSPEFYQAMKTGELDEFDALDEYRLDFIEWLSLYQMWLSLEDKYRQLITRQPIGISILGNDSPTSQTYSSRPEAPPRSGSGNHFYGTQLAFFN